MELGARYFDEAARSWDEKPSRVELARAVVEAITRSIPLHPDMHAMEYGCGTGLVSTALAPHLSRITAVDVSTGMLQILDEKIKRLKVPNITTMRLDLTSSQDRQALDGRFHLIFTSMTLHHIGPIEELIGEFNRLLEQDGWLAIADLDKEDGDFHGDTPGVAHHGFERDLLEALLEKKGFSHVRSSTAHVLKKETAPGKIKEFPVFLMVGRKCAGSVAG